LFIMKILDQLFAFNAALPFAYTPSVVMVGVVGLEHHKHVLLMHC
jgi:hypothetical protein